MRVCSVAAAQAILDEPRITFSVGFGYNFRRQLWAVNGQPYTTGMFDLTRRIGGHSPSVQRVRQHQGRRLGGGYTLTAQVRDNIVRLRQVTGPAQRDGIEPPSRAVFRHLPAITVGFGVVLEKRAGRRY